MGWISLWCRFSFQAWSGWIITKACSVLKWQQPLQFTLRYADTSVGLPFSHLASGFCPFDLILMEVCDCRTPSWISSSPSCTCWRSIPSPSAWRTWSLLSQTWRQSWRPAWWRWKGPCWTPVSASCTSCSTRSSNSSFFRRSLEAKLVNEFWSTVVDLESASLNKAEETILIVELMVWGW